MWRGSSQPDGLITSPAAVKDHFGPLLSPSSPPLNFSFSLPAFLNPSALHLPPCLSWHCCPRHSFCAAVPLLNSLNSRPFPSVTLYVCACVLLLCLSFIMSSWDWIKTFRLVLKQITSQLWTQKISLTSFRSLMHRFDGEFNFPPLLLPFLSYFPPSDPQKTLTGFY